MIYSQNAIMYLLTVATSAIVIVWFMILVTQIYFRKYKVANGNKIHYKLGLFPYSNLFAMLVLVVVLGVMTQMDNMRLSVYITPVWILILSILYALHKKLTPKDRISHHN
ncbi:MAG: hypothetical protein ACK4M7_09410 [Burkholderiales bacterium]